MSAPSLPVSDDPWPSIMALAEAVRAGRTTAAAETERAIARIGALNPRLNAVIAFDPEDARARAASVDRRVAAGENLPLAGVPVTIKDNIWVKGRPITQGSHLFKDFVAPESAVAVERLEAAGAVILGITNTPEFAAKGQTTNRLYGATRHPLDPALTPGGSSGGAVVSVASGMVPLALGTDAGGSSRRPPAHTGLVGFKPSFGAIPYGPGFAEPFFGISCNCPITRTVAEAALAFDVMAGPDPRDPHSAFVAPGESLDFGALTLAYSPKWGLDVPMEAEIAALTDRAVAALRAAGLTILDKDPDWPDGIAEAGLGPIQQAGLAALYGAHWQDDPDQIDADLGVQIKAGFEQSSPDVGRALLLSEEVALAAARFFRDHAIDAAIGPTTPCPAWPIEKLGPETIAGVPVGPRGHAVFTPLFNHARQPAISVPCGTTAAGLPIGLQIVAPRLADRKLLAIAAAIEAILD